MLKQPAITAAKLLFLCGSWGAEQTCELKSLRPLAAQELHSWSCKSRSYLEVSGSQHKGVPLPGQTNQPILTLCSCVESFGTVSLYWQNDECAKGTARIGETFAKSLPFLPLWEKASVCDLPGAKKLPEADVMGSKGEKSTNVGVGLNNSDQHSSPRNRFELSALTWLRAKVVWVLLRGKDSRCSSVRSFYTCINCMVFGLFRLIKLT